MLKPLNIPKGVAYLFCQGLSYVNEVKEEDQFRPDLLNNGLRNEVINNYMSETSPISFLKHNYYIITDVMFMAYFGRI